MTDIQAVATAMARCGRLDFMLVVGEAGPFEGSEDDEVVFGAYRRDGRWSAALIDLLVRLVGAGGTLIDVGAHVGLVCIPVVEQSAARALVFEPEARNHAFLRRNVERHRLGDRIETFELALFSERGTVQLALSEDNGGDHRVLAPGAPSGGRSCVKVEARTLDEVLGARRLPRPVVLKLDAQGSEVRILRGATRALAEVDHVVTELWPAGLARLGDDIRGLERALPGFAWGEVLGRHVERSLLPAAEVFASLAWIPSDGSDQGFFDVRLSRER